MLATLRLYVAFALAAGACCATAAASEKWPVEQTAGIFACHADFSLERHAALIEELSTLADDVQSLLGTPAAEETVHLFLFEKKATYQAYLQRYFPRVPYRRALFIKGRGPGMVFAYQGLDFEIDVRHECTHAVLHASLEHVPLWLDEGLAEYFEAPPSQRGEKHPHAAAVSALVKGGRVPRLAELEPMSDLASLGREEYRDAWAWVHFMLHGPEAAREELIAYLDAIQSDPEAEPLSRRLKRRLPDVERNIGRHFLRFGAR